MTFSSKIKQEISTTECTRTEYLSELSGIIRTNAEIKIYNIKIQTENKFVANRIFGLFKILYDINLNIDTDNMGIIVDKNMKTNIDGIYAAGDSVSKDLYQVVTAVSEGAIAATSIIKDIRS